MPSLATTLGQAISQGGISRAATIAERYPSQEEREYRIQIEFPNLSADEALSILAIGSLANSLAGAISFDPDRAADIAGGSPEDPTVPAGMYRYRIRFVGELPLVRGGKYLYDYVESDHPLSADEIDDMALDRLADLVRRYELDISAQLVEIQVVAVTRGV